MSWTQCQLCHMSGCQPSRVRISPVLPPSLIPTADSDAIIRGDVPSKAPIMMHTPSMHRVMRRRGKRALSSMKPAGKAVNVSHRNSVTQAAAHHAMSCAPSQAQHTCHHAGRPPSPVGLTWHFIIDQTSHGEQCACIHRCAAETATTCVAHAALLMIACH